MKVQLWMNGLGDWSWRRLYEFGPMTGSTNHGYHSRGAALRAIEEDKKMTERAKLRDKIIHQEELDL